MIIEARYRYKEKNEKSIRELKTFQTYAIGNVAG